MNKMSKLLILSLNTLLKKKNNKKLYIWKSEILLNENIDTQKRMNIFKNI